MTLAMIERLQAYNKNLRVAIVVPTIVLLNQWYDEIISNSSLPLALATRKGCSYPDIWGAEQVVGEIGKIRIRPKVHIRADIDLSIGFPNLKLG